MYKKYICEKLGATELWKKKHKFNMSGWESWKAIWILINVNSNQTSNYILQLAWVAMKS